MKTTKRSDLMRRLALLSFGLGLLLPAPKSHAFPELISYLHETYPHIRKGTYKCDLCHSGSPATATNLNPFGRDFKKNDYEYTLIEDLDSDGDGVKNIDELTAGKNPGRDDRNCLWGVLCF